MDDVLLPVDELNILYTTLNRLTQADTVRAQLEAVSSHARERAATSGHLFYFDPSETGWIEEVAHWAVDEARLRQTGWRLNVGERQLGRYWLSRPDAPTFIADIDRSQHVDAETETAFRSMGVRALAVLPLNNKGRWIGAILFFWHAPVDFDERDTRIFTALQHHAAPVIDAIRLFDQTQKRANELEIANREMDILYGVSRELVRASTPAQILEAVSGYAREQGAVAAALGYFEDFQPVWIEAVASWAEDPRHLTPVGLRTNVTERAFQQQSLAHRDQPTLIEDLMLSEIVGTETRLTARVYDIRGVAHLPLYSSGRWIGTIRFEWCEPHPFDERDERIFTALQRHAASAIASARLFDQAQKRASELEQINEEINLLYRASEVINRANTYDEVVEAVAGFDTEADVVTLMLWEHFDWVTAEFLNVVAVLNRTSRPNLEPGNRLPKGDFPIAKHMMGERVWLFEDARTDPRVDPVTAQSWEMLGIRSFMGPAFYVQQRWIGGVKYGCSRASAIWRWRLSSGFACDTKPKRRGRQRKSWRNRRRNWQLWKNAPGWRGSCTIRCHRCCMGSGWAHARHVPCSRRIPPA